MRNMMLVSGCVALLTACGNSDAPAADAGITPDAEVVRPRPSADWSRDILSYDLDINLADMSGTATIKIAGSASVGLSLNKGSLAIHKVSDESGDLMFLDLGKELLVGLPPNGDTRTLAIEYSFVTHQDYDGWDESKQLSFLWPAFCGNLFPCHSDPADGATFTMNVSGASDTVIYPASIPGEAPSYMPAIAVGDYSEINLGATSAGTSVSVWHLPGQEADAITGTTHLLEVFEFLETTYGPYSFGDKVGTVAADWGSGGFGGMEHHPYWHVANGSLSDEETNAHEAAHGWYGNGVRIACWEDFVLSEGVVTYMAARALKESGVDLWPLYDCQLKSICSDSANTTALLDTCGEIDLITHDLWSGTPYQKGAQYLREVAAILGETVVDEALAEFYQANVGKAVHMRDLVEVLKGKGSAAEIEALTVAWLETESCPASVSALCPS